MSIHRIAGREERETRRVDSPAEGTRQRILEILRAERGVISEQELATQLASDPDAMDGDAETVSSVRTQLYHLHLPKLADEGLVDWDRDAQEVRAHDDTAGSALRSGSAEPADDSIHGALTDDRQREIAAIVKATTDPILREDIARQLAGAESDAEPTESLVDEIAVQLHHHYLPKLDDDGFVEYDSDAGTVASPDPSSSAIGSRFLEGTSIDRSLPRNQNAVTASSIEKRRRSSRSSAASMRPLLKPLRENKQNS